MLSNLENEWISKRKRTAHKHSTLIDSIVSHECSGEQFFFVFSFLRPHLRHMQVSRLGVKLELQLPAHTTATATWGLSCVCDLHYSSWQRWILNPPSKARIEPTSGWILVRFVTC